MSIHYSAKGERGLYTITREIAGGGFFLNLNGFCLNHMYGARLSTVRATAHRHNGGPLNWIDEVKLRYA